MSFQFNSPMGFELRKSAEIREEALTHYKSFILEGLDPNDVFEAVFSQVDGNYDDMTDADKAGLIRDVEFFWETIS